LTRKPTKTETKMITVARSHSGLNHNGLREHVYYPEAGNNC